jgi:hypothetical protein
MMFRPFGITAEWLLAARRKRGFRLVARGEGTPFVATGWPAAARPRLAASVPA